MNVLGYIVYFGSGYIYLELVFHSFELNEKNLKSKLQKIQVSFSFPFTF